MSFVGTFLRSRSRHLPRSRDRSRTRQRDDVERETKKRGGEMREGERNAREDVQTESGSAWAENRALSSLVDILPLPGLRHWLRVARARKTHCVSGAEADLAQSGRPLSWSSAAGSTSASTSTSLTLRRTDANISQLSGHARPYHEAYRSHFEQMHRNHSGSYADSVSVFRH